MQARKLVGWAALGGILVFLACGNGQQTIPLVPYDENPAVPTAATGSRTLALSPTPELLDPFTVTAFTGLYYNNLTWVASISTMTGGCQASLSNISLSATCAGDTGHGFISMKVPANTMGGAEIITFRKTNYHYGKYEVRMKPSAVAGVCDAFFWQCNDGTGQEIDIEFLTEDFGPNRGRVWYALHPGGYGVSVTTAFNPADAFHTYSFVWTADRMDYYIDEVLVNTYTKAAGAPIPSSPGLIWLNCWTGNPNWGGGPPTQDATMVIDWVKFWPEESAGISDQYISVMD